MVGGNQDLASSGCDYVFKAGSRQERQLMRQRGAGSRLGASIDFGLSFSGSNTMSSQQTIAVVTRSARKPARKTAKTPLKKKSGLTTTPAASKEKVVVFEDARLKLEQKVEESWTCQGVVKIGQKRRKLANVTNVALNSPIRIKRHGTDCPSKSNSKHNLTVPRLVINKNLERGGKNNTSEQGEHREHMCSVEKGSLGPRKATRGSRQLACVGRKTSINLPPARQNNTSGQIGGTEATPYIQQSLNMGRPPSVPREQELRDCEVSTMPVVVNKKRGRPAGSKNKPKKAMSVTQGASTSSMVPKKRGRPAKSRVNLATTTVAAELQSDMAPAQPTVLQNDTDLSHVMKDAHESSRTAASTANPSGLRSRGRKQIAKPKISVVLARKADVQMFSTRNETTMPELLRLSDAPAISQSRGIKSVPMSPRNGVAKRRERYVVDVNETVLESDPLHA